MLVPWLTLEDRQYVLWPLDVTLVAEVTGSRLLFGPKQEARFSRPLTTKPESVLGSIPVHPLRSDSVFMIQEEKYSLNIFFKAE